MDIKCKRIIDGKTYNTETAYQLGGWTNSNEGPFEQGEYLYKNRHGAFFLYTFLSGAEEHDYDRIYPLSPDEAHHWLEKNCSWNPDLIKFSLRRDARSWLRRGQIYPTYAG